MKSIKITYKKLKEIQKIDVNLKCGDPQWRNDLYNFYRNFSTPFTYIFVRLGTSANAVSILNFFSNIIGYFFLSMGTYIFMIFGLLFFVLYKILDCSDGELAKIQNPKTTNPIYQKIEGPYFDAVGHFIEPTCLGVGLGVGLFYLYKSEIYITFGVILALLFTLEFALNELVRSLFRRGILERKIKLKRELKYIQKELTKRMSEGRYWSEQNILLRIFGIYPQGLIFSREFFIPILLVLVLIEYLLNIYTDFTLVIYGQIIGILSVYLFAVSIVKLIKIISFILKLKRNEYITKFLNELQ